MEANIKKQVTIRISEEILEKARDIVYEVRELTLNEFLEEAIAWRVKGYVGIPKRPQDKLRSGRKMN